MLAKPGWGQHLGIDTSLDIHWLAQARHVVVFSALRELSGTRIAFARRSPSYRDWGQDIWRTDVRAHALLEWLCCPH
uniref:Uncharacterized protein n=1 Tax=Sphaerodactylus townsendi TaxID=933632 RepID=A0ACB8F6P5_9SAUR